MVLFPVSYIGEVRCGVAEALRAGSENSELVDHFHELVVLEDAIYVRAGPVVHHYNASLPEQGGGHAENTSDTSA